MPEENNKPAKSYYWTAGIALLWNLMGFSAYIAQVTMAPEALNALPEAERALYENVPGWATGAFAFAVSGGVLGCVLLLLRNGYALPVFMISLLAVLVQNFNSFFLMDAISVVGPIGAVFSAAVVVIGVYLIWFTMDAQKKGWIP